MEVRQKHTPLTPCAKQKRLSSTSGCSTCPTTERTHASPRSPSLPRPTNRALARVIAVANIRSKCLG
jgi:hypothetical protein